MLIEVFRSFFIGAVQGISEFLPISSSGHLVLVPYIFNWQYDGLAFDVALHFGTVIAIIAFFWSDWINIIANAFNKKRYQEGIETYPSNLLWQIAVASIPVAILGVVLNDYVEKYLHSPLLIAFDLIFFGIVLWLADKYSKKNNELSAISYNHSFWIGISQALALVPGVSRSGITMTAGRLGGLTKKDAARFAFLLATPAMLGAFVFKLKDIALSAVDLPFVVGVIASALFGFLAIKFLLKYLEKGSFVIFVWYRIIVATIVLFLYFR